MARPLWKDLRRQRSLDRARPASVASQQHKAHYGAAILSAIGAIAAAVVGSYFQKYLHQPRKDTAGFVIVLASAGAFVILGSYATRRFATQMGRLIDFQGGRAAGSAVRLIATLIGLIIVLLTTLGMVGVPASRILVGGAITGVVLGIAAQQSLGNVFAGLVLITARPFTVGSRIRVRSGALGGIFDGEVISIGLTYVLMETDDGPLYVPNLSMLAAGVVQLPDSVTAKSAALYVNRSMAKRPPRHSAAAQRRTSRGAHSARLPRELIRRMRDRRLLGAGGDPLLSGHPSTGGPPNRGGTPSTGRPPGDGNADDTAGPSDAAGLVPPPDASREE